MNLGVYTNYSIDPIIRFIGFTLYSRKVRITFLYLLLYQ